MLRFAAVFLLNLLCAGLFSASQTIPSQKAPDAAPAIPALSPSEAYRYAMQPFVDARSAPNDLTDADQWALGLGAARAREQCEAIAPSKPQGEDLLAFAKLCVFGQNLGRAEDALTAYLGLPKMGDEKSARLLLTRIFVQVNSVTSAESQIESITSTFPYDADIHWAIDQAIDAAETQPAGMAKVRMEGERAFHTITDPGGGTATATRLNNLQLPFILKALSDGGTLKSSDSSVDAAVLVRDGLRCADALREAGEQKAAANLVEQLRGLTTSAAIMQSASEPGIESAFARYLLAGQPSPIKDLRGTVVAKMPAPAIRRFSGKSTLLIAFSLGAPQFRDAITKLAAALQSAPPAQVIAVTSYGAMNGDDEKSETVLATLQALQATMPAAVPMMIVPDADLKAFAIDAFPAAIVINPAGRVTYLNLFPGTPGSVQMVVRAFAGPEKQHPPATKDVPGNSRATRN